MTLGRWLGPSFDVGEALTYAVLTPSAEVVHRSSVIPLSTEERNSEEIKALKVKYTEGIERKLGDRANGIATLPSDEAFQRNLNDERTPFFEPYDDDEKGDLPEWQEIMEEDDPVAYDKYISAKVQIQHNDTRLEE